MKPPAAELQWTTAREAVGVLLHPLFLKKTLAIALLIGAILFLINHLDEVLTGQATAGTWAKSLATCLVPFAVANWGILAATRRRT